MSQKLNFVLFLVTSIFYAQPDTEVYLFNVNSTKKGISLELVSNISNNPGYDNQPYFYNDNIIIYAATQGDQTEIAKYNLRDKKTTVLSQTPNGSEYSPTKIPEQKAVSAIRLGKDGTQLLYKYDFTSGKSDVLIDSLKVGYHSWYTKDIVICAVLVEDRMDLYSYNIKRKSKRLLDKNVGRSIHKIPNSSLISYISKENKLWEIRNINPISGERSKIINTITNNEDMCWLNNGTILLPVKNRIYYFNPQQDTTWNILTTFKEDNLHSITRITTNEIGNLLALVSETSPEKVVQQQLDAYNNRDIEAFAAAFSEDVEVYNFPNQLQLKGRDKLKNAYDEFFKNTPNLHCILQNRIVHDNKVIDEELVTINDTEISAVAIYEVTNGKISKVTFIR
ncbi:nuclear transport factor 2 family protein [Aquimarina brevivitae]|uniref:Uncharacterized protein (TIGR02246 family) n=1 Tax=Aquimarina brevivitae TaxID=323412 RepID=A0A4Q7P0W3_9FLAO|nr:nuclear transport factor 2 family protein [Aquimarina brevivitae]RZS93446.1 uncharacterized protein (TIGR02246 family) [Aquimarina brevivitae]